MARFRMSMVKMNLDSSTKAVGFRLDVLEVSVAAKKKKLVHPSQGWTFLTNHTHVLICLAREPSLTLREVASLVGITERAVQRIVSDLEEGGYLSKTKEGRNNIYHLSIAKSLRHPVESNCDVRSLVQLIR